MARRRNRTFGPAENAQPAKLPSPPPVVDTAAVPDVVAVPALQKVPRVRCQNCGGKAIDAHYRWQQWRYYRCAAERPCVDPETSKTWITKVLADED